MWTSLFCPGSLHPAALVVRRMRKIPGNRAQVRPAERDDRPVRSAELFAEFSRVRQVVSVVVVPVVFGVVAAITLKWTGAAWWTWQGLGVLGAFIAGREHRRWWRV